MWRYMNNVKKVSKSPYVCPAPMCKRDCKNKGGYTVHTQFCNRYKRWKHKQQSENRLQKGDIRNFLNEDNKITASERRILFSL